MEETDHTVGRQYHDWTSGRQGHRGQRACPQPQSWSGQSHSSLEMPLSNLTVAAIL